MVPVMFLDILIQMNWRGESIQISASKKLFVGKITANNRRTSFPRCPGWCKHTSHSPQKELSENRAQDSFIWGF
jgi:hypothetical protein